MFTRFAASVIALGLALPASAGDHAADASTVVATVNGVEITLGHLIQTRQRLPQQYQQLPPEALWDGLVNQLVQQELLSQNLEEAPLRLRLALENETRSLRAGETVQAIRGNAVSEEQLRALYDERYGNVAAATEYNASHILVETEEEAAAVIGRLEAGEDFGDLARELSTGPSGPNGGQLGWFTAGTMVPPFQAAVEALEVGGISPPVLTQFGWHVVILNDTREQEPPAFETVADELGEEFQQAAVEAQLAMLEAAGDVTRPAAGAFDPSLIMDDGLLADE